MPSSPSIERRAAASSANEPAFGEKSLQPKLDMQENWEETVWIFEATAPAAVGQVTLRLLDHHRVPIATQTRNVVAGKTQFRFPDSIREKVEMAHLQFGAFHAWQSRMMGGESGFGFWFLPREN